MTQYQHPATNPGDRFGSTAGRKSPHKGQDYAPNGGGPARAIADGHVVRSEWGDGMGWSVVLLHPVGKFSGYSHLAAKGIERGARVSRGDVVGTIGNTGSFSKGRHLHLTMGTTNECCYGVNVFDPAAYINARLNAPASAPAPAAGGTSYPNGWLGKGSQGEKVAQMQRALKAGYFYAKGLATDGDFGTFTDWVVREFQRRAGLKVDGLAGPVMFAKLGLKW